MTDPTPERFQVRIEYEGSCGDGTVSRLSGSVCLNKTLDTASVAFCHRSYKETGFNSSVISRKPTMEMTFFLILFSIRVREAEVDREKILVIITHAKASHAVYHGAQERDGKQPTLINVKIKNKIKKEPLKRSPCNENHGNTKIQMVWENLIDLNIKRIDRLNKYGKKIPYCQ